MFNYFLTQLIRSITTFGRVIRAFFTRRLAGVTSFVRRITNVSRGAAKAANAAVQSAVSVSQKPSKREDYVETSRFLISKALIVKIVLALLAAALIGYFLVWPFVLSHFLTARFYVKDDRVEDWTGKVIVYSDQKKTVPLYAGELEDGVLQGRGQEYDEAGLIAYEGQFQDGVRSGSGVEYEDGVVVYEGQFALGVREGTGTEYRDGEKIYTGQFQQGVYSGQGKQYNTHGILLYEGNFQDGLASGNGTSYYAGGETAYKGQFAAGQYEGVGTAYSTDGRKLYEGNFSAGAYDGEGTLYLSGNGSLAATFAKGQPEGTVQWSKGGKLYYEGEWENGPQGFGKLLGRDGETLYQGQFDGGTVDGAWLLTRTAQELREVLGSVKESSAAEGGFLMESPKLGLTALCSFQTEEEEPMVYSITLFPIRDASSWVELLPGEGNIPYPAWPEDAELWEGEIWYTYQEEVEVEAGVYDAQAATTPEWRGVLLQRGDGATALLQWERTDGAPETLEELTGGEAPAETLNDVLESIDNMEETASGDGEGSEEEKKSPVPLLKECATARDAKALADALLTWWEQNALNAALQGARSRSRILLEDARTAAAGGAGGGETVSELEKSITQLDWQIEQNALEMEKTKVVLGDINPDEYALSELAAAFDPAGADYSELLLVAQAYAVSIGREVDRDALAADLQTALLALIQGYNQIQNALETYQWSIQTTQNAAGAYAMGSGEKSQWYTALSAQQSAQAQVCGALAEYTRQVNALNETTGGWFSRTFDWFPAIFTPLYEAEVIPLPSPTPQPSSQPEPSGDVETSQRPEEEQEPEMTPGPGESGAPEETAEPEATGKLGSD